MVSSAGRKVAVVTGGTAGVGRAAVIEFARNGYDVAILARGKAGLAGAVGRGRERLGGTALGVPTDVADDAAVDAAAERVETELGEIDVWVNVAFVGSLAFSWDTGMEEFRRMTEVTYYGQVYGTLAALSSHAAPQSRRDHQRRLGDGLPVDPAAVDLLRRQARDQGLHRVGDVRARAEKSRSSSAWCSYPG